MAILNNSNAISTAGGYDINNSLRIRNSASGYLSRSFSASSTDRKKGTISFWVKRGKLATQQCIIDSYDGSSAGSFNIYFLSGDTIVWRFGGGAAYANTTSAVYRDPSAWYHVMFVWDTTQATDTNRMKLYVNGVQQTFASTSYPSQNATAQFPQNGNTKIGCNYNASGEFIDTYFAEYYFVDGQALSTTDFGETDTTTGSWKPKAYTGTYGTNGFYLKFSDIATTSGSNAGLGKDFSGNTNYWTTNNISVTAGTTYDAMTDVPTLTSATVANYCVINPIDLFINIAGSVSNGNLRFTTSASSGVDSATTGTMGSSSGSWYFEWTITQGSNNSTNAQLGILQNHTNTGFGSYSCSLNFYTNGTTSSIYKNGSSVQTGLTACAETNVIGIAFDATNGTVQFYRNNVALGSQVTGLTSGNYVPFVYAQTEGLPGSRQYILDANFGQRPFTYTPPTGFNRLNTYNLPDSTIKKGNSYMDATLYTGNGTSQTITTASSFKPDLVWIKGRSFVDGHTLFDTVRGATISLSSNTTTADVTRTTALTAFTSTGFTVGSDTLVNYNANTLVAWQWKAGQGSTSSNTSGTITSTVSVNATAGFSVVTFTGNATAGSTVGHGLGVAPKFVIYKARNNGNDWWSYHVGLTSAAYAIQLNTTNAQNNTVNFFNSTAPSATVLTLGYWNNVTGFNLSTQNYVAYCWAEIAGFSKFGSYTGNGSADGTFVYTGFRPKFLMWKRTDTGATNWNIIDTSRNTYNVTGESLEPNLSDAGAVYTLLDILSNGFKNRNTYTDTNASGGTYIYAAFAENPFKNSLAR